MSLFRDAVNHWIDFHPLFSREALMTAFPWMGNELAEEDISFWLEHGLVESLDHDRYRRTSLRLRTPLLFLDVDGVLNHNKTPDVLDDECIENLAHIVTRTGALLILISSWKFGWHKEDKTKQFEDANLLDERLRNHGLTIADKSSIHLGGRAYGVADFVMRYNADAWIILDDEPTPYKNDVFLPHLIQTSALHGGLTKDLAEKAIETLASFQC